MNHFLYNKRICASAVWCDVTRERNNAKLLKSQISCMTAVIIIKFIIIVELIWSMTHIQGQEVQTSYMDGITVKISEQYKPPPKINLPITYAQRLLQNKYLQDNMANYNFDVERRTKEELQILKRNRNAADEYRKLRSERIKEEMKEREEAAAELANKVSSPIPEESSRNSNNEILQPMKSCGILMPIPLKNTACEIKPIVDRSPFNISDFEADTSSPFDNMELKTLNDMEELAQVLRSETPITTNNIPATFPTYSTSYNYNSYLNTTESRSTITNSYIPNYAQPSVIYNGTSDFYSRSETTPYHFGTSNVYNANALQNYPAATTLKTVPDILKALETKLGNQHINDNSYSPSSSKYEKKKSSTTDFGDPFSALPKNLQDVATTISTMGFPLPRVARACQLYGDDHKKVVEYLLAMSELMDLGFPEKNVSSALQQCNNDRDKALDKLIL